MTGRRDPDRLIRAFLSEGEELLSDPVYDSVRDEIERTRQRGGFGSWRTPALSRIVPIGLAAAAVVVALLVSAQLFGTPTGGFGGPPDPTPTPEVSVAAPTPWSGIRSGPFVVTSPGDPVQVTLDVALPGWTWLPSLDAVMKDDDGLDPPDTVGAALFAWAWPAGTGFTVYGDPCQWSTTAPDTPAGTPDEIATALAAQASRGATEPADVTVGGYAGKKITLHVPMEYEVSDATREEKFAECDESLFVSYGTVGGTEPERYHQGPGQIDELWILDVDGAVVILDAMYGPAAPDDLVDELRALAESATFELP